MSQHNFSRRSLFGTAAAAVAVEAGARLFCAPLAHTLGMSRLQRAVFDGDGRALADDAFAVAKNPMFILTVQAKWESAGWLNRPNPKANGIIGNPLADVSAAYTGFGLTKMFGDYLAPLNGNVGMAIIPVSTTSGNHVYDGLRATMSTTGCLPAYVSTAKASLMSLHFSSVGTADGATACFDKGGVPLISYPTIDSAVSSLLNALGPLQNLPAESQHLLSLLNDRVTKDERFRKGLEDLAGRLHAASDPLNKALSDAKATPMQLTAATQLDETVLATNNPLLPQLSAVGALIDLGLIHAATLSISNSDPNAGGDHAGRGGSNVAYGARSPNEVKSCVAQAVAKIFARYPNALVSITSDGGRSPDGGDSENFEAFIFGPSSLIKTTFVNADSRNDSAAFGSNPMPATLSDGTRPAPNQAHVMATVAKAAGIDLGTTPYIPALLANG